VAELRTLAKQGKHEQVVAAADAAIAALPPAARLIAWQVDFGTRRISRVLVGESHRHGRAGLRARVHR
jgi:hypothetical protein